MGIEQLVDMYKGNPGPLEAKVEKDQQGQKPGELPEDLEEAIALQKIAELQNGAKNQQAMQAGGAQPSIVEKLRQMLAANQRQQAQPPQMPQGMPQGMPPQQGMPQMAQGQPPMPQGPQGQPPMPQGQPVMAARGGSIDQLMSNLGRHYAGGGIIAFSEGNEVKDPEEDKRSLLEKFFYSNITPAEQRRMAALRAIAAAREETTRQAPMQQAPAQQEPAPQAPAPQEPLTPQQMESNVRPAPLRQVTQKELAESYIRKRRAQREEDEARPKESYGAALEKFFYSNITPAEQRRREALQAAADERMRERPKPVDAFTQQPSRASSDTTVGRPAMENDPRLAKDFDPTPTGPGAGRAPGAAVKDQITGTSPDDARRRPSGIPAALGAGAADVRPTGETLDPNSLRALVEANIRKELGKDEDAEWRKGSKRYEDFMGLDKLLQPREARIAERQEMLKRIQGERTPAWVEALSAAGRPVRGGLGTLLSQMGGAAESTRKGYSAEDLKFFDEIGAMQDEVAKLKLEGKYKAAAAGEAAIKDTIANKRQSEQSGTSLIKTDEDIAMRKQLAKDAAAGRAQTAAAQAENKALALEEKKRQFNESELRKIREKDVERATKIEAAIAKRTGMIDLQLQSAKLKPETKAELLQRRNDIVKQVQAEYPPIKPEKPSMEQFLTAARAANPGVSDADLKAYYNKTYGS